MPSLVICRGKMSLGLQILLLPKQTGLQGMTGHLYGSQLWRGLDMCWMRSGNI